MDTLIDTIQQIKNSGLSPTVQVNINLSGADLEQLQEIKTRLAQLGITPQVHLVLSMADQPASPGEDQEPADPGVQEPVEKEGFLVMVRSAKVNCMNFTRRDNAGKPVMEPVMPRVQLFQGNTLRVSARHRVSEKDSGDGSITATGGLKFYFITDSPNNRAAEGLYIRQEEVTKSLSPAP